MKNINVVIIPEWGRISQERKDYYEALYEDLSTHKINVGFAPNRGVLLGLLRMVAGREERYLFLTGEGIKKEDRSFVHERLAEIGYGPEMVKGINELSQASHEMREGLEEWLREIRATQGAERRRS